MVDLADIGRGLLTLEINTIVSDGIVAERMPPDGQALIRIAQRYKSFLMEILGELAEAGSVPPALPQIKYGNGTTAAFGDWDVASGGLRTFDTLRRAAHSIRAARSDVPRPNAMRPEHDAILVRVAGTSADIQALLRRIGLGAAAITAETVELAEDEGIVWPAFDHDALLQLRRIWETGVDVVVMQTVVRLDGGAITRVLDGWDSDAAASVHDLHYRAVDISLQRWSLLVQTAGSLAGFFLGGLRGTESARSGPAPPMGAAGEPAWPAPAGGGAGGAPVAS